MAAAAVGKGGSPYSPVGHSTCLVQPRRPLSNICCKGPSSGRPPCPLPCASPTKPPPKPTLRPQVIVASKFDNRLKEFGERWEVDKYLSASGYLPPSVRPFFVALPKADRGATAGGGGTSAEWRRSIQEVDARVLKTLSEGIEGGFDAERFGSRVGFGNLRRCVCAGRGGGGRCTREPVLGRRGYLFSWRPVDRLPPSLRAPSWGPAQSLRAPEQTNKRTSRRRPACLPQVFGGGAGSALPRRRPRHPGAAGGALRRRGRAAAGGGAEAGRGGGRGGAPAGGHPVRRRRRGAGGGADVGGAAGGPRAVRAHHGGGARRHRRRQRESSRGSGPPRGLASALAGSLRALGVLLLLWRGRCPAC